MNLENAHDKDCYPKAFVLGDIVGIGPVFKNQTANDTS